MPDVVTMPDVVPLPADLAELHAGVLAWYAAEGRPLAFRATTDPWAILVSEVMAQQTQAARAAEAWEGFVARFPTPAALAAASPALVLRAWRGLGYNRRAIALRDAATRIVDEHEGRVPGDLDALRRLPGVGPYTARAVAALAFGASVGPVDTNVRRVLGRAFFEVPPPRATLQAFADAIVPTGDAGTWTHALMDVGARLCRPRAPRCAACPLRAACRYARHGANATPARASTPGRVPRSAPFESTSRWLRGRILDRLRDASDGEWVDIGSSIGGHDAEAVRQAVVRLERDGLLERHPELPAARLRA